MGRHTEQLKEQMDRATQHFHRRDNEVVILLYIILLFCTVFYCFIKY